MTGAHRGRLTRLAVQVAAVGATLVVALAPLCSGRSIGGPAPDRRNVLRPSKHAFRPVSRFPYPCQCPLPYQERGGLTDGRLPLSIMVERGPGGEDGQVHHLPQYVRVDQVRRPSPFQRVEQPLCRQLGHARACAVRGAPDMRGERHVV